MPHQGPQDGHNKGRRQLSNADLDRAMTLIRQACKRRLEQKGRGTLASRHEILGMVTEEYIELNDAVREGTQDDVVRELEDIATACYFGIASIKGGKVDW